MGLSRHVDGQLLALIERRLSPDERARVEAHLAVCAQCRAAAGDLFQTVDALQGLPGALRALPALPMRAAGQWPAVWARVRAPGTARQVWPHVGLSLSLVTTFLAFVSVAPGLAGSAPAGVTAGVALGPRLTQPATVVYQAVADPTDSAATLGLAAHGSAEATVAGTSAIQPIPIPTPVPVPQG